MSQETDERAVDTGAFKKAWHAFMQGDLLIVRNRLRYSAYVELGTILSKKHQFKIRDALRRLGLREGEATAFGVKIPIPQEGKAGKPEQSAFATAIGQVEPDVSIPLTADPLQIIPALIQLRLRALAPSIQAANQRQQFLGQRSSSIRRFTTILGLAALLTEEENEIQDNTEE